MEKQTLVSENILITSMYRSGSTHIAWSLSRILKWRMASLVTMHGEGSDTQVIAPVNAALLLPYGSQVFHHHVAAGTAGLDILSELKVKPVVVLRDLADSLVSVKERIDYIMSAAPDACLPGVHLPKFWSTWTEKKKFTWVADFVAPIQVQFRKSWEDQSVVPIMTIRYRDFFGDGIRGQVAWTKKILEWHGLSAPEEVIIEEVSQAKNLAKGKIGRGKLAFSKEQMERLARLESY